jgi:hypothetical protein
MRNQVRRACLAMVLIVPVSLWAGQKPEELQVKPNIRMQPLARVAPRPSDPFAGVFGPASAKPRVIVAGKLTPGVTLESPRVVCGMTIVPLDPAFDARMRVVPDQRQTQYTIRAARPPICK